MKRSDFEKLKVLHDRLEVAENTLASSPRVIVVHYQGRGSAPTVINQRKFYNNSDLMDSMTKAFTAYIRGEIAALKEAIEKLGVEI